MTAKQAKGRILAKIRNVFSGNRRRWWIAEAGTGGNPHGAPKFGEAHAKHTPGDEVDFV